jgi:purine nucleosidase
MARRIILDCDTGRDDALAIALACASPREIELLGVTTVAGNIPLELVHRNSRMILEVCGRPDIPVFAGSDRPLFRPHMWDETSHGAMGIAGVQVFEPKAALADGHAVDFIIDTLRRSKLGTVDLVVTGPMTNIALVAMAAPDAFARIREVVVMGGSSGPRGNMSPAAEFNIFVDAEAAAKVLSSGRPVTMFGLDVTYQVLARPWHRKALESLGGRAGKFVAPLLTPLPEWRTERLGPDVVPLHDPCTIAWLIKPELFHVISLNVEVETQSALTYGETVVDRWNYSGRSANVNWALEVDGDGLIDLVVDRLSKLG